MTIAQLQEKRAKAIADARAVMTLVEGDNRDLNAEESQRFDAFMTDAESMRGQITRLETLTHCSARQHPQHDRRERRFAGLAVARF